MTMTERAGIASLLTLLIACGGDPDGMTGQPDAGDDGNAVPAFLVGTRVWDDSSTTSYFHVTESLEAGSELDLGRALEVPGAAKLFSIEGAGWFAIGGGEAPTITSYSLDDDGRFVEGVSISLQAHGVQSLWDTLYVVSPTKVYYPDRDGQQLVIWNPTAMELTGSIPLPQTAREGYLSLYGYSPILRGDELLFTVGWFDWVSTDSILGETGLVVIDTITDSVARFDVDDRCGGVTTGVTTASGDTYFVSSALAGVAHELGRQPTAPCALRVGAGEASFDSSYVADLGAITGATIAGEPVPAGGDAMFLRVLDAELATVDPEMATWEITGQLAWRWSRWDVTESAAAPVDSLEPGTADVLWFRIGDRVFGTETTADYAETTLIELTAAGGPQPAMTVPGFLHGVASLD